MKCLFIFDNFSGNWTAILFHLSLIDEFVMKINPREHKAHRDNLLKIKIFSL